MTFKTKKKKKKNIKSLYDQMYGQKNGKIDALVSNWLNNKSSFNNTKTSFTTKKNSENTISKLLQNDNEPIYDDMDEYYVEINQLEKNLHDKIPLYTRKKSMKRLLYIYNIDDENEIDIIKNIQQLISSNLSSNKLYQKDIIIDQTKYNELHDLLIKKYENLSKYMGLSMNIIQKGMKKLLKSILKRFADNNEYCRQCAILLMIHIVYYNFLQLNKEDGLPVKQLNDNLQAFLPYIIPILTFRLAPIDHHQMNQIEKKRVKNHLNLVKR